MMSRALALLALLVGVLAALPTIAADVDYAAPGRFAVRESLQQVAARIADVKFDLDAAGRDGVDFAAVEQRGCMLVKAISTAYWQACLRCLGLAGGQRGCRTGSERWLPEDQMTAPRRGHTSDFQPSIQASASWSGSGCAEASISSRLPRRQAPHSASTLSTALPPPQ